MKLTAQGHKVGGIAGSGVYVNDHRLRPSPAGTATVGGTRVYYQDADALLRSCALDGSDDRVENCPAGISLVVASTSVWAAWTTGIVTVTSWGGRYEGWIPMLATDDGGVLLMSYPEPHLGLRMVSVMGDLWADPTARGNCLYPYPQACALDIHRVLWVEPGGHIRVRGLKTPAQVSPIFDPFLIEHPDSGDVWLGYHNTDCRVHPLDYARRGYVIATGDTFGTSAAGNHVGWARTQSESVMQSVEVDWSAPLVDLTLPSETATPIVPINRALWFGFYEFAGPTDCPVNCRLKVESSMIVRDLSGRPLYRYVAGDPDGDVDAIDHAVASVKGIGYSLDVLAYVPRGAAAVRLPDAVVGVECYRRANESLADFEASIRHIVARCQRVVLIAQCYTSNAGMSTDLRSIPPVIARVARDMTNVEGVLVFSGSGRGTGFQDHPEVQADWRQLAGTIQTPTTKPIPPIVIPPTEVPMKIPTDVMTRIKEFVAMFPIPQASDAVIADPAALEQWVNDALREGWTLRLVEQLRFDFGEIWSSKGTSPTWKSKEAVARWRDGKMDVWDMLKGAATGRPVLSSDPTHHYVGIDEGAHRIGVAPINHLEAIIIPSTRPTITKPFWGISSFDLAARLASGDRRWIDEILKPSGLVARVIVASFYRRPVGEDAWTTQQKLDISRVRFRAMLQTLKTEGLRCEPTLLCDTAKFKLTRAEALEEVRKLNPILVEFAETIEGVRGGNELSHDVEDGSYMLDPTFWDEVEAILDPRFPFAVGAGHGGEAVKIFKCASYGVHHAARDTDAATNATTMKRGQDIGGRPVVDAEQIGVGEPGTPGQRVFTSEYLLTSVREALRLGLGGVIYHLQAGLTASVDVLGPLQRETWKQFVELTGVKSPIKETGVTTEQIAQVLAGNYFEEISKLLGLSGTVEARREAIHWWAVEWIKFIDAEYVRIFGRRLELEGAGSRFRLAVIDKYTQAKMTAMLEKAKANGAK